MDEQASPVTALPGTASPLTPASDQTPASKPVPKPPRFSVGRDIWRQIYPPGIYLGFQVVVTFAAVILAGIFFGFMNGFAAGFGGGGTLQEDIYDRLTRLATDGDFLMGAMAVSALLSAIVFFLLYRHERPWYIQTASAPIRPRSTLLFVIGILCLAFGMQCVIGYVIDFFELTEVFTDYNDIAEALSMGSVLSQLLTVGLIGPIAEELCFRGLLFNRLRMRIPFVPAALISSLLFGIVHLNILQGLYAALLGLLLAWLYHRVRSIWAPILLHISFNTISVVTGFISKAGLDVDVAFGLSAYDIVFFTLAILAIPALIVIALKTKRSRFSEVIPTVPAVSLAAAPSQAVFPQQTILSQPVVPQQPAAYQQPAYQPPGQQQALPQQPSSPIQPQQPLPPPQQLQQQQAPRDREP